MYCISIAVCSFTTPIFGIPITIYTIPITQYAISLFTCPISRYSYVLSSVHYAVPLIQCAVPSFLFAEAPSLCATSHPTPLLSPDPLADISIRAEPGWPGPRCHLSTHLHDALPVTCILITHTGPVVMLPHKNKSVGCSPSQLMGFLWFYPQPGSCRMAEKGHQRAGWGGLV